MASFRLSFLFGLLLAVASAGTAAAAPGDLDPSFGTFGKYLSPVNEETSAQNVVLQPDDKILVGGGSSKGSTVYRFTSAGQPDPSFGQDGRVVLSSTRGNASIALQGDKVVAAAVNSANGHLDVFRLESTGALDPGFGSAGVSDTGLPATLGVAPELAVTADSRIVVAARTAPVAGLVVARLLADGGPDPSFSDDGVAVADIGRAALPQAIASGPGDEVTVLTATFSDDSAASRVLRFATDGTPDPSFGSGGQAVIQPGGPAYLNDMAVRADGSAVVVGFLLSGSPRSGVVAALTPTGQLDASFGSDGVGEPLKRDLGPLYSVGIDAQGRILATGSGLLLLRYLPDGTPDPAFGTDGAASANYGHKATDGRALAIAPDGRIVVAAHRITGFRSDHVVLGLMRFLVSNGPHDADADGVVDDRDRCPDIGAKGHRGCPLIDRDVEVRVKHRKLAGTVTASDRACRGVGKAVVYSVQKGRDRVAGRLPVSARGNFKLRFGPRFEGRVYARIGAGTNPLVGLCGPAVSKTVSIG